MRKNLLLALLLFCTTVAAIAQSKITGKVTSADDGTGLPGVTVQLKGTKAGTQTNTDGVYSIEAKKGDVLTFTFVGMSQQSVTVGNQSTINVALQSDAKALSEIVVTGAGTATNKSKLGISVETLTSENIPTIPSASLDQAMVGKIPGAQISSISGNPGDKVNIVLRGINSVQGGTRPMILLNGVEVPFENLTQLDMTQVERIEVVQGAASASLYGAQGANGVIQIFTKKGAKGRMSVNASTSYAMNTYLNIGDFGKASLHPYLTDASGNIITAGANSGLGYNKGDLVQIDPVYGSILGSNSIAYKYGTDIPGITFAPGSTQSYTRYGMLDPRNVANQPYKGNLKYYDHFKQVFGSAPSLNNSISFSGGSDRVDYSLALSNNNTQSAMLQDNGGLNRTNLTTNIGIELFKGFKIRSITNLAYTTNDMHPNLGAPGGDGFGLGTTNGYVGGVFGFLNTSPFFDLTAKIDGDNYASYQPASFLSINSFNPYYRLQYTKGDSKRYDIMQNFEATYSVNKFLNLVGRYGISFKNENDIWTFYNQSNNENSNGYGSWASWYNGTDNTGELVNWQYNNTKQNFYTSANFKTDLQQDFGLNLPIQSSTLVAFDMRKNDYKELNTWGITMPFASPFNLTSTQKQTVSNDFVQPFVTYGYVLDQKFDYGNLFGISGGFRTDYSSAFGAGTKPFTFPHYNGYINLSNFSFLSGLSDVVSKFKIRAAYGKAGIQPSPFDRYPVLNLQPTGSEISYTNQISARNPNLDVEVSSESEIGTDISVGLLKGSNWFKNLNLGLTFWKRSTDNAIFVQNVPPSTGATSLLTNAIALSSNGWQLSVNIPIYYSKNFEWNLTSNFGHQTSMIDKVTGGDIPLTSFAGSTGLVLAAGRKIGELYGYKALTSIDQKRTDGSLFIPSDKQAGYEIVQGRVVNKSSKSIFFSDEAESLGDPNPTLTSSFINNLAWKNIVTLGFQWDWVSGSHLYNQTKEWMYRDGISNDFQKPVTINGETGAFTAYYGSAYYALGETPRGVGNNVTKDFFYEDASFVRLRNVNLGVDMAKFVNAKWLTKCQLVLSGRNLLTYTKYSGMDPEISSGASNSAFDRGVDHSTIPNLKAYQITLNLGF